MKSDVSHPNTALCGLTARGIRGLRPLVASGGLSDSFTRYWHVLQESGPLSHDATSADEGRSDVAPRLRILRSLTKK